MKTCGEVARAQNGRGRPVARFAGPKHAPQMSKAALVRLLNRLGQTEAHPDTDRPASDAQAPRGRGMPKAKKAKHDPRLAYLGSGQHRTRRRPDPVLGPGRPAPSGASTPRRQPLVDAAPRRRARTMVAGRRVRPGRRVVVVQARGRVGVGAGAGAGSGASAASSGASESDSGTVAGDSATQAPHHSARRRSACAILAAAAAVAGGRRCRCRFRSAGRVGRPASDAPRARAPGPRRRRDDVDLANQPVSVAWS